MSQKTSAIIALAFASIIWGATAPVMKLTLTAVPVFTLAFLRFGTASILLLPFVFRKLTIKEKDWPLLIAASVCGVTLNISFFFLGLKLTTALNAGVIIASTPILTMFFAHLLLKEKITQNLVIGGVLGFGGIGIIIGRDFFENGLSLSPLGDFLILLALLAFVLYEVFSKKLSKKYSSFVITFYSFAIGAIIFFPAAISEFQQNPLWMTNFPLPAFLGLVYGAVFSSFAAYSLWQWGLAKISVSRVGFFFYLDPVVATIVAVILLSEKITPAFVAGAVFIFLGLFLAEGRLPYHHQLSKQNGKKS